MPTTDIEVGTGPEADARALSGRRRKAYVEAEVPGVGH